MIDAFQYFSIEIKIQIQSIEEQKNFFFGVYVMNISSALFSAWKTFAHLFEQKSFEMASCNFVRRFLEETSSENMTKQLINFYLLVEKWNKSLAEDSRFTWT